MCCKCTWLTGTCQYKDNQHLSFQTFEHLAGISDFCFDCETAANQTLLKD